MRVQDQKVANGGYILHGTILEGKSIGSIKKKKKLKRRAHDYTNQDAN
jgi:hypothetical protein